MICNKVIVKAKIIAIMDEDFNDVAAAADDDNSEKSWPNLPTAFSMFSSIPGSSSGSSLTSERKKERKEKKETHADIYFGGK